MELNQSYSNTTLFAKKSSIAHTSWKNTQAVIAFIDVLAIILYGIVIFRLFRKRHHLGAIMWLLIHFFVVRQLRDVFDLPGILPNRMMPVGDSVFACVIGFFWLWLRSTVSTNVVVICFYSWFHTQKIIKKTVSARSLPGILLGICLTWILSLGQTCLLLNIELVGTVKMCKMVAMVNLWAQITFFCFNTTILFLGLLVGLYTRRIVRRKLNSFLIHRAQLCLTVRTELKRCIQDFKVILPTILIQNFISLLWVLSFLFSTYVSGNMIWYTISISMYTGAKVTMSLWILWLLKRADHQQITPIIELNNNPEAAADLHNTEIERTWEVKPKSSRQVFHTPLPLFPRICNLVVCPEQCFMSLKKFIWSLRIIL